MGYPDQTKVDEDDHDSEDAILRELKEYYDYDVLNWATIREQADIDVRYASNDTWEEKDTTARAGRPMLNLDQLSQYRNQVENTVRQNKRGVKVSPAGQGATDDTATLRANRIREIEYQSHAQEAYSQAFSDCLTRSYGFARIVAEYEDEESDNQVFRTKSIPNPNQVVPDSDGQSTSGRDWKRCFFLDNISHAEFRRSYPDAKIKDFDTATIERSGKWVTATRVQIAEYWRVIETPNPKGYGRPKREVCMYLTNGLELLAKKGQKKKHEWKGKYIPFAACYGRIIYKGNASTGDSEKMMLSYIRFARDAAKGYNWTKSTMLEKIALPVRAALMGYKGQADQTALDAIDMATKAPVAWIEFSATTNDTGTQVLPLPQYGTREPDIQADLLAAEGFQRDIQNALGHFNASDARLGQSKVTSGIALAELKRSGDLGSFDFQDHYDDFLKFLGEQYDDLLTHYDDAAKEVATREPDGSVKIVPINTPTGKAPDGTSTYAPTDARMDVGRHTVTIATGPSSDSQREAGKDAAMTLLSNPQAFPAVASDCIRLLDLGPVGDQMAEDLEFLQSPAQQQARKQKAGGAPDPRQLQQELEQAKQQIQHAEGVMQQMDADLKGKQAEIASKEKIELAKLELQRQQLAQEQQDKQADREVKLAVAEIGAKVKVEELFIEERARLGVHEQAAIDRSHAYVLHQEKIASAERIAAAAAQQKLDLAAQAARASRSVQFTKGSDGAVQSATITGDAGPVVPA